MVKYTFSLSLKFKLTIDFLNKKFRGYTFRFITYIEVCENAIEDGKRM